jgi:transketolase
VTRAEWASLNRLALRVRERTLHLATDGGCFLGASLSCTDLLVTLYQRFLRVSPEMFEDPARDFLFLSKGHDVPALYALFVEMGWMPSALLARHLEPGSNVYWHPSRRIPGVEFHSGSLGHLLPVAIGVALDVRLRGGMNRVVVVLGDGELDEGSIWEALLFASALRLSNLFIVVDRNGFQANARTEELVPLEPLAAKFEAFGCAVRRVDGHEFAALDAAVSGFPYVGDAPSVLIADTIRGKGLPSIEGRADRWFCNFTAGEVEALVEELHGVAEARLTSEGLVVR